MKHFLLKLLCFATLMGCGNAWAEEVTIATFSNSSNEGWTIEGSPSYSNTGGYQLVANSMAIITPEIIFSNYTDISIQITARKYGGPNADQGKISVKQGEKELVSYSPSSTSLKASGKLEISPSNGQLKIYCPGASSSKGCGISEIKIFGNENAIDDRTSVNIMSFSANNTTLIKGGQTNTFVANDQNSWTASYNYTSNNTDVATVNESGVITAVSKGSARITVSLNIANNDANYKVGTTASKYVDITVKNPSHTAQFSVNGDINHEDDKEIEEGEPITFPADPADIEGKKFVGWSESPINGTSNTEPNLVSSAPTMGTSDLTYYAVFANVDESTTLLETVGFESSEGYTAGTTYNKGSYTTGSTRSKWTINYGAFATSNAIIGRQSAQFRIYSSGGGYGQLRNTVTYSSDVTMVQYSAKTTNTNGQVKVSYSTNSSSWTDVTTQSLTTTTTEYTVNIPVSGVKYIKFTAAGTTPSSGNYSIFVDGVKITTRTTTYSDYCTTVPAPKTLHHIGVTGAKTLYKVGESFSTEGMIVTAYYDEEGADSEVISSEYTVNNNDPLSTENDKITISYTEGEVTKTADVSINVVALDHIAVTTPPTKTEYQEGDNFDATGMVVTATWGTELGKTISEEVTATVTNGNSLTEGKTSVTISYTHEGTTKETTQSITVSEAEDADVVFDFTDAKWGISEAKVLDGIEHSYTLGDYTVKIYGDTENGFKYQGTDPKYLAMGREGAYLTLPAFPKAVAKIVVVGSSANGASTDVQQNIFVGDEAVSDVTTGCQNKTLTYNIEDVYQAAGNVYTLKVVSHHNTAITKVKVYYNVDYTPIYKVRNGECENGSVSASVAKSKEKGSVTVTATPDAHYSLSDMYYIKDGDETQYTIVDGSFEMPASHVTVYATFTEDTKYTATFSVNGQTSSKSYYEGETIAFIAPTENIPAGMVFVGWTSESIDGFAQDAPTLVSETIMGTEDVTYYAVFATETAEKQDKTITLDFVGDDWGIPVGSSNKTVDETEYSYGGYSIKLAGNTGNGFYLGTSNDNPVVLMLGKTGAYLKLPVLNTPIKKVTCLKTPNSSVSANVTWNVYAGEYKASTDVTGCANGGVFAIKEEYQKSELMIKVTNNYNTQFTGIEILTEAPSYSDYCTTVESFSATIAECGYTTVCLPYNAKIVEDGAQAYALLKITPDGALKFKAVDAMNAGEGYVVAGEVSKAYTLIATASTNEETNLLQGVVDRTKVSTLGLKGSDNFAFPWILAKDGKFKKYTGEYIPANKAYLDGGFVEEYVNNLGDASSASLRVVFEESEQTGLETMTEISKDMNFVYDLTGKKVQSINKSGLYIVNGKKVVIK